MDAIYIFVAKKIHPKTHNTCLLSLNIMVLNILTDSTLVSIHSQIKVSGSVQQLTVNLM